MATCGGPQAHPLAHPMAIPTDGSGTVLEGERERYVVEFVDPGKRTAATVNLAGLGIDEGAHECSNTMSPDASHQPLMPHISTVILGIRSMLIASLAHNGPSHV